MFNAASRMGRRAVAPLLAASSSTLLVTACDDAPAVEEDKYANLPEKDEPTACQICMINRQGPCRDLWRRFERCMKDNMAPPAEGEKEDISKAGSSVGSACDKYMMPWIECLQNHPNLYSVLANDVYQHEFVDFYEEDLMEQLRKEKKKPLPWKDMEIDWSDVWEYAKEKSLTLNDFGASAIDWGEYLSGFYGQRDLDDYIADRAVVLTPERATILGDSMEIKPIYDPVTYTEDVSLMEVRVRVNLADHDGMPIDICYARDQTGRVLGFDQFASQKEDGVDEAVLRLNVEHGKNYCVKLYKAYKGEDGEVRFYISKAKFLVEAAFEAGLE